jgi:hypothetical protein
MLFPHNRLVPYYFVLYIDLLFETHKKNPSPSQPANTLNVSSQKEQYLLQNCFSGVRTVLSLVFLLVFCRLLFVILSFFSTIYCLSFFDLRLLNTTLKSSNFSYSYANYDKAIS